MVKEYSSIEQTITSYIEDVQKQLDIKTAYVFGSYAKKTNDEKSDLDIAVFTSDLKNLSTVQGIKLLLKIARKYKNICIEPVIFEEDDKYSDNPFVKEILKTGVQVM